MAALYELGANEVIPEEFETSIEIFVRVLARYLIPRQTVDELVVKIRADGYQMLRSLGGEALSAASLQLALPDVEVTTFRVTAESEAVSKSLAEIGLRKKLGVTVLSVCREGELIFDTIVDLPLCAADLLYVIGKPMQLLRARRLFEGVPEGGK